MDAEPALAGPPAPQAGTTAVLTTAAINGVLAVIALCTGVLAARLLGPEGRGHLAAAQAVGSLLGAVGTLALGEALVFFVGRRARPAMVVLRTATLVAIGSMAGLIALAWATMPRLLAGQPEAVSAARAYVFIGVSFVLLGFPISLLRALQRYSLWNALRLLAPSCWLAVLVVFTLATRREATPLVAAFIVLQMLFVPWVWVLANRQERGGRLLDLTLVRPMLCYSAPLLLATLPYVLNLRLDQLLIANVETADQLGLYAVSVSWAAIGLPLMTAIGSVLFPKLAGMDPVAAWVTLARSARAGVLIALGIGALSAISAPALVPLLFGESFAVPIMLPVLLAAATSLLGLNGIIEEGLRGLGEPRTVLIGELVGLAVTVALLFTLVRIIGITGAAVASLAGFGVVTATLAWRVSVLSHVRISDLLVPRRGDLRSMLHQARAVATRRGPGR